MNSNDVTVLVATAVGLVALCFCAQLGLVLSGASDAPQIGVSSIGRGGTRGIACRRRWAAAWRSG